MGRGNTLEKDYRNLKEIGRGGFGIVYKAIRNNDNKEVAIKIIDTTRVGATRLSQELKALRSLKSMHIVEFYDDFKEDDKHCIVMEYCSHGSLRQYIKEHGPLSDESAAFVLRQLALAVNIIHKANMMHRDLSTGNVLIYEISKEGSLFIKLADFGLATHLNINKTAATIVGTPGFIAPQVYERSYGPAADVYSLGCILYSMLTGKEPPRQQGELLESKDFYGLSNDAIELIENMLQPDPDRRIQLTQIQRAPFCNRALGITVSRDGYLSRERSVDSGHRSRSKGNSYLAQRSSLDRVRSHPNKPIIKRKTSNTKSDSAFESDTISHYNEKDLYSQVPKRQEKISQRSSRNILTDNNYRNNGTKTSNIVTNMSNLSLKTIGSVGFKKDNRTENIDWPLKINFLGTLSSLAKAGRFSVSNGTTFTYESIDSNNYIQVVMIVDQSNGINDQIVKLHFLNHKIELNESTYLSDELLNEKRPIIYRDLNDILQSRLAKECYTRISYCAKKFSGRVARVIINSPEGLPKATAKYMFNGDFRLILPDGRIAVQKVDSLSITCTDINNKTSSLSEEETFYYKSVRDFCLSYKNVSSLKFSSDKENLILPPDKYKLKYARDGKIAAIQTEDSRGTVRLLRESTTQKNVYIYTEKGGYEKRFVYKGQIESIPSNCRAMLQTLLKRKSSYCNS
uniref:Protein kinase domain-containing protein n=1 Tax=Parastrongyloides trichosuri TaxID=131310 RepID=A0A0N4ZPK8_PARTI